MGEEKEPLFLSGKRIDFPTFSQWGEGLLRQVLSLPAVISLSVLEKYQTSPEEVLARALREGDVHNLVSHGFDVFQAGYQYLLTNPEENFNMDTFGILALFHDLGRHIDDKNHPQISAEIVETAREFIAREIGLNQAELDELIYGILHHDVGFAGIDDEIFNLCFSREAGLLWAFDEMALSMQRQTERRRKFPLQRAVEDDPYKPSWYFLRFEIPGINLPEGFALDIQKRAGFYIYASHSASGLKS